MQNKKTSYVELMGFIIKNSKSILVRKNKYADNTKIMRKNIRNPVSIF